MENEKHPGPINLGNPNEITISSIADEIIDLTGSKSKIVFKPLPEDDPKKRRPDITLAKDVLNWDVSFDRASGIKKTIKYLKKKIDHI